MKSPASRKKSLQLSLLPKGQRSYGGQLRNTRRGRQGARALTTTGSIHLVLRSSRARGAWSFLLSKNRMIIKSALNTHAKKNFVNIISVANVGNHLHIHLKIADRILYKRFIRAVTGIIALKIMSASKNTPRVVNSATRFWDYRPFTRIITDFKYFLNLEDYILINQFEGLGFSRAVAHIIIKQNRRVFSASG